MLPDAGTLVMTELATTVMVAPDGGCEKNGAVTSSCDDGPPMVPAAVAASACRIRLKRLPAGSGADGVMLTELRLTAAIAVVVISLPSASRNCASSVLGSIAWLKA